MHRPPHKSPITYFLPFVILAILLVAAVYLFFFSGAFQFSSSASALLSVKNPEVQILLKNNDSWRDVPQNVNVKLVEGDTLKTSHQGEAKIQLAGQSFLYLDNRTGIEIHTLQESENFQDTNILFHGGKMLVFVDRILNPKSEFSIDKESLKVHSRGATFVLSDDLVQVLKGTVQVDKIAKETVVATISLGVGQQLNLTDPETGAFNELEPLPAEAFASPWIEKALGKAVEQESTGLVSSAIKEETSTTSKDEKDEEGKTTDSKSDEYGVSAPLSVSQTSLKLDAPKEVTTGTFEVLGHVSANAVKVKIDDYTLSQFKEGSVQFLYRAKESLGNLKAGKNTYTVTVEYKDGSVRTENFSIDYNKNGTNAATSSSQTSSTTSVAPVSSEGITIISPAEGEKTAADPVTIRGTAPAGTAKVTVGGYALRTFTKGDAQWKYNASQAFGNLTPGVENTFVVTAFDDSGNAISSVQFSFFSTAEKKAE